MGTLLSVQLLRAAAALGVALWHLTWVGRAFPEAAQALAPPRWLACGYAGVDLFFVISGFIISHVANGGMDAREFALRRFVRIVPFYALFTFLAVFAVFLNPVWDSRGILDPGYILRSFLLIPMRESPYLGVGWSLEHELLFYLLAGGLLAAGALRLLPGLLAALFGVGVAVHVWWPSRGIAVWDFHVFSLYHFEFLVGVGVYHARASLAAMRWKLPLALGAAGFLVTAQSVGAQHPTLPAGWVGLARVLGYGIASGLLLVAALNAEERLRRAGRVLTPWFWIGEASFVLYLSHFFLYSILSKLYTALGVPDSLAAPALLAALLAAVGFAVAFHYTLERPFLAWARSRTTSDGARGGPARVAAAGTKTSI